jgi:hypothetical protein
MLRVRFNIFALAAYSRLASVDAKSAATERDQQIETVVKTIQSPTVRAKASACLEIEPEMLAAYHSVGQPHRHNLLRAKFGPDVGDLMVEKHVSIGDVAQELFEINALVITEQRTLVAMQSRHVALQSRPDNITSIAIDKASITKVTIVTGESGSGKTYGVVSASQSRYGVTIVMIPADFKICSSDDAVNLKSLPIEERNALFLSSVAAFLTSHINEKKLSHRFQVFQESIVPITLFLDEMGQTPSLVQAMGRVQADVRELLRERTKTTSSRIRLVAAGTGLSHSSVAFGSNLDWFEVVPVVPEVVWKTLQEQYDGRNFVLKNACGALLPSPAATALNLIASNARCAALICKALDDKMLWQLPSAEFSELQLWYLYHTAAYDFKRLSGFEKEDLKRCKNLFARAFYLHLTRHDQDLDVSDQELITRYGILTDTAQGVIDVLPRQKVVSKTTSDGASEDTFPLVISKGSARYTMSPAAAQLGVSCFGFLDVASDGFARRIAQLLQHVTTAFCGHARGEAPDKSRSKSWFEGNWLVKLETEIFPTLRIPKNSQGAESLYSGTRLVTSRYRMDLQDIAMVLSAALPKVADDPEKEVFLARLQTMVLLSWIVVVVNGPHASGPDVMVLALDWYMGVQCKMCPATSLGSKLVGEDVAKMVLPSFSGVQHCCVVVAGEQPYDIKKTSFKAGVAGWMKKQETDAAEVATKKAMKAARANPQLKKWSKQATTTAGRTSREAKVQKLLSSSALHFIHLGDTTATASRNVSPFCIPVGQWCAAESIESNSEM